MSAREEAGGPYEIRAPGCPSLALESAWEVGAKQAGQLQALCMSCPLHLTIKRARPQNHSCFLAVGLRRITGALSKDGHHSSTLASRDPLGMLSQSGGREYEQAKVCSVLPSPFSQPRRGGAPQNAHSNAHTFPTMPLDVIAAPL